MPINRIAFGFLAVTCVAAAGGGAYLATRHNQAVDRVVPAAVAVQPNAAVPTTETETIVDETPKVEEPRVEETPARAVTRPAPSAKPTSSREASRKTATSRTSSRPNSPSPQRAGSASTTATRDARTEGRPAATPDSASSTNRSSPAPQESAPQVAEAQPQPVFAPVAVESRPPVPEKTFEDLTVAADAVLGLQIDKAVTSEKAKVEDKVEARVTRDVKVGNEIAIPAGSRVEGSVTLVETGGKLKDRARLGIRFHTLVLADGTRVPLSTDAVYREGTSPAGASTAKIGGAAVGGAILGAIMGGGKGAAIGGSVGAAGGTAAVMAGDRNPATLPAGSTVTVRILSPVTVTVEK